MIESLSRWLQPSRYACHDFLSGRSSNSSSRRSSFNSHKDPQVIYGDYIDREALEDLLNRKFGRKYRLQVRAPRSIGILQHKSDSSRYDLTNIRCMRMRHLQKQKFGAVVPIRIRRRSLCSFWSLGRNCSSSDEALKWFHVYPLGFRCARGIAFATGAV